ncbi:MAG: hypothetical protein N2C14_32435, partial [Planctomycetales bacterium]
VRWPVFGKVHGEGLLLEPMGKPVANVVAIPDADQTPEMIAGLTDGVAPESQYARRLAESGCRVVIPLLINRKMEKHRAAMLTNREFLYRSAFELGRHLIGYEIQKVRAAAGWLVKNSGEDDPKLGIIGWGEGGLISLRAGAIDERFDAVGVSGYFDSRQHVWQEPLDRNVWGLLEQFGDAETASMIAPRALIIEAAKSPELVLPSQGGAPGRLVTANIADVKSEVSRARKLVAGLQPKASIELVIAGDGTGAFGSSDALRSFLAALAPGAKLAPTGPAPQRLWKAFDHDARMRSQIHEIDRHNQRLLLESTAVRKDFFKDLDTSSLERFEKTIEPYRERFREDVIGAFDQQPLPLNLRARKTYDEPKWTGFEVAMDVFPDVFAYGILLLPKDMKPGERRPAVVCQHGLEGRPQDVVQGDHRAYHDFAAKLAERGFVVFAPQNIYIGRDRFRVLQRKANPIKKSLFSVMVPQHQRITDWLGSTPWVDQERIAFYGLSYGGKTAMRVPPLVKNYCLSICSADFNEWVWKNASTRSRYSYVGTGEYEIFEFDHGGPFK